ncbi:flagellar protein FlhE [Escherichia coli]
MTLVAWRYQLIGPTPSGLRVRLCSRSRCVGKGAERNHRGLFRYSGSRTVAILSGKCAGGGRLISTAKGTT